MSDSEPLVITRRFADDGRFPNNGTLPLVMYKAFLDEADARPERFQELFNRNRWAAAWVNGLFDFHHYHSTSHEVLGVCRGWARVRFGGPDGETLEAGAGDVIVIPAGVSHCNMGQSTDFQVAGGYPFGCSWDLCRGLPEERPEADRSIESLALPQTDPVYGPGGPLLRLWR